MTISIAFLGDIKSQTWPVTYVQNGSRYKVGDQFKVFVTEDDSIAEIEVRDENGKRKDTLVPIPRTIKIGTTEPDMLTITFKFENDEGQEEHFFLRFFFFAQDPTLFRFITHPVVEGDPRDEKCVCHGDPCSCNYGWILKSDDGGMGGGGPGMP